MSETKEFSVSSNGDRWFLEVDDGQMTVVHKANVPSGGHQTRTSLADFIEEHAGKPEHSALLQLLGQSQSEIQNQLGAEVTEDASLEEQPDSKS